MLHISNITHKIVLLCWISAVVWFSCPHDRMILWHDSDKHHKHSVIFKNKHCSDSYSCCAPRYQITSSRGLGNPGLRNNYVFKVPEWLDAFFSLMYKNIISKLQIVIWLIWKPKKKIKQYVRGKSFLIHFL